MNKIKLIALTSVMACTLLCSACQEEVKEVKKPVFKSGLPNYTNSAEKFAQTFPLQFAAYKQNDETMTLTPYKGSVNFRKEEGSSKIKGAPVSKAVQPYLKNLWLGYPFSYEYNEARGHTYALIDQMDIDRINRYGDGKAGMPATCWNCKTPHMVQWVQEYGDKFWSMDFNTFRDKIDIKNESISCATCHKTDDMELQLYSVPLKDWLKRSGKEWSKISRNEQRSLMCAQCHVEYYFTPKGEGKVHQKPVFPWDNGFELTQMYEYYKDKGPDGKPFFDFIHAVSKVPIIKAQHPDYEAWISGPHGAAGVSCADCHMPYKKQDGKKYSSHWWTSPLRDPDMTACMKCHNDKTPQFLKDRVEYTQKKTYDQLLVAQDASVKSHEAVRLGNEWKGEKTPKYEALMKEARENVRKGQFFWDMVSAENSMGFHNPAKSLDGLMLSLQCSNRAVELCIQATNGEIVKALEGDIHKIVPPIMNHSRKLQQSAEHLASHKWLSYLPKFPESKQVWEMNKRIDGK